MSSVGFRAYDEAIQKALTTKIRPDIDDASIELTLVPIFSGMAREYADQESLEPKAPKSKLIKDDKTVKLPALSLSRMGSAFDLTRWTKVGYRHLKWTEDGNRILQSPHPLPLETQYQLDIWTKYRNTMNQLTHRIMLKFLGREVWLPVDLGDGFGIKRFPLKVSFGGPQELSDLELDSNKDRTFRMAITLNAEIWFVPDIESVPTVKKLIIDSMGTRSGAAALPPTIQAAIESLDLLGKSTVSTV
jgi:hypothetical protein